MSARALCQQRLHERNPVRLSQIGLGDWWYSNTALPLSSCRDITGGELWRNWSQYRKFSISFGYTTAHSGQRQDWLTSQATSTPLSAPYLSWSDGEPQKPHSVLAYSSRRMCYLSCCHDNGSPVLPLGWFRGNSDIEHSSKPPGPWCQRQIVLPLKQEYPVE